MNNEPNKTPTCPICRRPRNPRYVPFCSKRCADVDLHRWLTGAYIIADESDDADLSASPSDDDTLDS